MGSLSWCAGGTAARIWSRQGRRAAGYTWRCSRAFGRAGRGGRGGNALGVSGTVPRHTSRPLARTHVCSASRSPPQGRGGPRCASVTCSGRLRPSWSTELPPPGPQPQPRPSHATPPASRRLRRAPAPMPPSQSQASVPAAEPMSDELLPGGREPNRRLR